MRTRRILAIAVVVLVIVSAGCTGWGTDGPVDRNESNGTHGTDDLETTGTDDNESNASESSEESSEASAGSDSNGSDDGSAETESSAASGSPSDDSSATDDAADDSDGSSGESETNPDSGADSEATPDDTDSGTDSSEQEQDRTDDTDTDASSENDSNDSNSDDDSDDGTDSNDDGDDDSDDGDENGTDDTERNSSTDDPDPETHTLTVHAGESVPVSGVPITIERHSDGATTTRETGEDGQVEFTVVDGDYTVSGTDPNGTTDSADVTVDGEDTQVLLAGLTPALPAEHDVRVTVTDAETGEPIEGAVLEGVGNRHPRTGDMLLSVTTGADGVGESTAFESPYESTIRADGYEEQSETVVVDGETSVEYRLEPETTGSPANGTNTTDGNATNATPA